MICSPAEILTFLGKAATAIDAERGLLTMLQPMVEAAVKREIGYSIEQATYTHYLPRAGTFQDVDEDLVYSDISGETVEVTALGGIQQLGSVTVPELPLRSVTSLYEDASAYSGQGSGDFGSSTLKTQGTDYWFVLDESGLCRDGKIRRLNGYWPSRAGTVKVTYVAGYTQAELTNGIAAHLKKAVLRSMQHAFNAAGGDDAGTIKAERLGDYSVQYAVEAAQRLPADVLDMLAKDVNMGQYL